MGDESQLALFAEVRRDRDLALPMLRQGPEKVSVASLRAWIRSIRGAIGSIGGRTCTDCGKAKRWTFWPQLRQTKVYAMSYCTCDRCLDCRCAPCICDTFGTGLRGKDLRAHLRKVARDDLARLKADDTTWIEGETS